MAPEEFRTVFEMGYLYNIKSLFARQAITPNLVNILFVRHTYHTS